MSTCEPHHLRGIHEGRVRVSGRAPDELLWALGVRDGLANEVFFRGERRRAVERRRG